MDNSLRQELAKVENCSVPMNSEKKGIYNFISKCTNTLERDGWSGLLKKSKTGIRQRLLRFKIVRHFIQRRPYNFWISKNEPDKRQLDAMKIESESWPYRPKISIITPVYNTDKYALPQCIKSVLEQVYDNWELCLVDGGSDKAYVGEVLQEYAVMDSRIKFRSLSKNLGIAGNSSEAMKLATGEYIAQEFNIPK